MSEALNPRAKIGGNNPPSTAELLKERHKPIFERARKWLARAKQADLQPKTIEDCKKLEELFGEGRDIANDADRAREAEKEPFLKACREVDDLFNGEVRDKVGADTKKPGLARQILQAAADRRAAITRAEQQQQAAEAERLQKEADRLEAQRKSQEERGKVREADVTAAKVDGLDRAAEQVAAQARAPMAEASRDRTSSGRSVSVDMKLVCTNVVRAELNLEALRPYFRHEDLVAAVNAGLKIKAFDKLAGAAIIEQAVGRVR